MSDYHSFVRVILSITENPEFVPEYVGFINTCLQQENNFLSLSADL
jgi:hypothetical protein